MPKSFSTESRIILALLLLVVVIFTALHHTHATHHETGSALLAAQAAKIKQLDQRVTALEAKLAAAPAPATAPAH